VHLNPKLGGGCGALYHVREADRAKRRTALRHEHERLRHACGGYKLANDRIEAYLGRRNIQNTTRYTALAQVRFKNFWRD